MKAWFAIISMLAFAAPLLAEEPPAADLKLLESLRAEDFDAREIARDTLIARGDAVRGLVTAELEKQNLDPDYKACLKAVLSGLREQDALKPFDSPQRLDLELKDELMSTALHAISKHFKQPVATHGKAGNERISLSLKGATFMEAVDAVRRAAKLEFYPPYSARHVSAEPERYAKLALAKPARGASEVSAAKGPFAVSLSRVQQQDGGGRAPYMMISGALYFEKSARFSRIKIESLTAIDADKKEYSISAPGNTATALRVYRIWSGDTVESGSFTLAFDATFRSAEKIPPGLNWKLKLAVEIPVKIAEEQIDNLDAKSDVPQALEAGSVTIGAVRMLYGEWAAGCDISGDVYLGLQAPGAAFSPMTEGPHGSSGQGYPALKFLDEKGAQVVYQVVTKTFNRDAAGGRKAQYTLRFAAKPRSMVFTRTLKAVTREYELEIPTVPVPFGESALRRELGP